MKLILFIIISLIGMAVANSVYDKSLFRSVAKIGIDATGMECSNCSSIRKKSCSIKDTNYLCSFFEDRWKVLLLPDPENYANQTRPYEACMPPFYTVVGVLESFCCFWSPETGCRQLKNSQNTNEDCSMCTETEKDMYGDSVHKYCPCNGELSNSRGSLIICYLLTILCIMVSI
ncbi:uncharacterized protein LOC111518736 [Drosophila willistoni]|uniref:uncharacterized protein LOC111518736 n=1 Tax=Drosophila willistoni TaxID=7260 RepID=UPI001F0809A8|nr:uncharacterized protein LOC111518736 [Drosophila willistoni]